MSKKRTVQIVTDNSINYGQIINPADVIKSQEFAHAHAENITQDFLTQPSETDVAGFAAAVPVGMGVNIALGRIYQNGYQFDGEAIQLTFEAANTQPRIDLIIATVALDSPEMQTYTPFQRIRTSQELGNGTAPYPPVQFQVPLEKHNKVTLSIKKGVAASSPVQPTLAAGEIALWAVTVPANASALISSNFADLRRRAANLRQMRTEINSMLTTLTAMQANITTALNYHFDQELVGWVSSFGGVRTIHSVMEEIGSKLLVLKFRYPSMLTGDGRIQAVAGVDNTVPVIDIPIGTLIQFGDKFVTIEADAFTDNDLNARQLTSGINNTDVLFDGMSADIGTDDDDNGNTIRINAPSTQQWLYVNRDGELYFKPTLNPSGANECLLLRSKPNGSSAPTLLKYINLRSAVIVKSGEATSSADSKRFVNDIALPPGIGYTKAYGIRNSDQSLYNLTISGISAIDQVVDVLGVAEEGDKWVVEMNVFSIY